MNNHWFVFTGVLLGVAVHMTMQTLVATMLPAISAQLGDSHLYSWVFTGYLLMSTVTVPLFSKLADIYGYKLFFLLGLSLFLLASLLCGLATSLAFLVGARLVQGIGAGMIAPVTMALISVLFPLTQERAKAMSLFAAVQMLANVLGPVLGGMIAAILNWSAAFFMVIPLGVLSFAVIYFSQFGPVSTQKETVPTVDYIGAFLLGGAITAFTQTWSLFEQAGWTFAATRLFVASVILGGLFFWQEKRHPDPILAQDLLRLPQISLATLSALLAGILNFGTMFMLPLLSVATFANDPAKSSYFLLPFTIGVSIGAVASGFLLQKISCQSLAKLSWCFAIIGFSGLGFAVSFTAPVIWFYIFAVSIGYGIGSLMPTFLLPAQNAVNETQQATVSGLIQISRNIGGTVGIPLLTSLLVLARGWQQEALQYALVFFTLAFFSCLGLVIGNRLKV